jgi:hypothetical protein
VTVTGPANAPISSAEVARRRAILDDVRHSTALEGGRSSDEVHAAQDRWAAGEITYDELGAIVLRLHPTSAPQ